MLQPYPLALNGRLDFSFDATELLYSGDSVASWVITPSSNMTVWDESEVDGYVIFWARWTTAPAVGTAGTVAAKITSTLGRVLEKTMDFFAVEEEQ